MKRSSREGDVPSEGKVPEGKVPEGKVPSEGKVPGEGTPFLNILVNTILKVGNETQIVQYSGKRQKINQFKILFKQRGKDGERIGKLSSVFLENSRIRKERRSDYNNNYLRVFDNYVYVDKEGNMYEKEVKLEKKEGQFVISLEGIPETDTVMNNLLSLVYRKGDILGCIEKNEIFDVEVLGFVIQQSRFFILGKETKGTVRSVDVHNVLYSKNYQSTYPPQQDVLKKVYDKVGNNTPQLYNELKDDDVKKLVGEYIKRNPTYIRWYENLGEDKQDAIPAISTELKRAYIVRHDYDNKNIAECFLKVSDKYFSVVLKNKSRSTEYLILYMDPIGIYKDIEIDDIDDI